MQTSKLFSAMSRTNTTPEELAAAARLAFLLLDRKGTGIVSRTDVVLSLSKLSDVDFRNKAPKMEAWLEALAQPRTFSNIFDAMNTSKSKHLTLEELTFFVQEQADIQKKEREEAEQLLRDEKQQENNAATKISAITRARHDRKRVTSIRQRKNSAIKIQNQFRMRDGKKKLHRKRVEKKRETIKEIKRQKYRKEMTDRKAELDSHYQTKRKGTLSPTQLHKATERTRQRALVIRRKQKAAKAEKLRNEIETRKKKEEQLAAIPGVTRQRRSSSVSAKKSTSTSVPKTTRESRESIPRREPVPRQKSHSVPSAQLKKSALLRAEVSPHPVDAVSPVVSTPLSTTAAAVVGAKSNRIVVKAYTMGVAFGRQGVGYRLSIDRRAPWSTILAKLEGKFDQNGDVGAVGIVRDEDGCMIQNTNELLDNDRIFVCRLGEKWEETPLDALNVITTEPEKENATTSTLLTGFDLSTSSTTVPVKNGGSGSTTTTSAGGDDRHVSWSPSIYEAPFFRDMRASDTRPTVFETRENETLAVTSVGGVGRLVVSVYDSSQILRVPEAVVFDSNTWFFLRGGEAALSTALLFPGGFFYHFRVIGPFETAKLSARFIVTSTYEGKQHSVFQKSPVLRANAHKISMQPLSFSNSFGSPEQTRNVALAASNRASRLVRSPEYPSQRPSLEKPQGERLDHTQSTTKNKSFDGGASLILPSLSGGGSGGGAVRVVGGSSLSDSRRRELPPVKQALDSTVLHQEVKSNNGSETSGNKTRIRLVRFESNEEKKDDEETSSRSKQDEMEVEDKVERDVSSRDDKQEHQSLDDLPPNTTPRLTLDKSTNKASPKIEVFDQHIVRNREYSKIASEIKREPILNASGSHYDLLAHGNEAPETMY